MHSVTDEKILLFDGTLQQGGAERVISILSRHMVDAGYNVEILLYYDREIFYEIHKDIRITCVERESGTKNILRNLLWMRKYLRENANIVISFLAPFNILALLAHLGLKSTIIVADRNDPRFVPGNKFLRFLRDTLYRFADGAVFQTSRNKAYFPKSVREKATVIFNPVAMDNYAGLALHTPKKKKIVSVGRLMPQKNQKMLLYAFARVSQVYPDYELFIYGEGPEHEALESLAQVLGIQAKVHLPGSVTDVFDQIADAKLFVLSSDYEGMPNALIEAMCLGLPCISTRVSGTEDLIDEGVNGEIVDVGDAEELANRIQELLAHEKTLQEYAENATKLNEKLDTEAIMRKWLDFLEEM